ncbi:hypothetical protein M569_15919 [Genlisea aurea]|uniref:Uncharacterized protein n=1 Tax=Genlisea aurea TaxID=192259 RepID=S8D894_9LAMI|nr:hypothetical protein M569_15919 [Genlisea aurea]
MGISPKFVCRKVVVKGLRISSLILIASPNTTRNAAESFATVFLFRAIVSRKFLAIFSTNTFKTPQVITPLASSNLPFFGTWILLADPLPSSLRNPLIRMI